MDIRLSCIVVVFVSLLCALVIGRSEGRSKSEELNFFFDDDVSPEINEEMWEQLHSNCKQEFIQMKSTIEAFGIYIDENEDTYIDSKEQVITKVNLQSYLNVVPPHLKRGLLDCMQKRNVPVLVSGEEADSKKWYIKYLEYFFGWSDASRRYLGENKLHGTMPTPRLSKRKKHTPRLSKRKKHTPRLSKKKKPTLAPAPSPSSFLAYESPTYAPEPSSALAPASLYVPNPGPAEEPSALLNPEPAEEPSAPLYPEPAEEPSALLNPKPTEEPSAPSFPPDIHQSELYSADLHSSASPSFAPQPSPNENHTHVQVAVAVGGTAAGTFAFALALVICYHKSRKDPNSIDAEKDDNPFLTIALRGDSCASSRKSSLGGTMNKEMSNSLSSNTHSNPSGKLSSLSRNMSTASGLTTIDEASSLGTAANAAARSSEELQPESRDTGAPAMPSPLLKPPPGRASPTPPGPPPPPAIPATKAPGPPPPPPPKGATPPPPPPKGATPPRAPPPLKPPTFKTNPAGNAASGGKQGVKDESESQKSKLKPFFWDKVVANPDQSMVWHQISSGSFQFDEEMIENLFGHHAANKNKSENKKGLSQQPSPQYIHIIDSKKAQNILILLRALNVTTEEVRDALHEGNELPMELLQTMLKMAPTQEEELKLRLYSGEISQLGPAERFLKVLVDIPFAFKRMDTLLFKKSLEEEISSTKECLATLEVASKELRNSRLFLKLLEAVLKTGNRMNAGTFRGSAQAFKLDTLLKLADVRGTDGKTTLLHFVVQEIIRSEGKRAARGVSESEFQNIPSVHSQDLVDDSSEDVENYYRSLGLQVVSGLGAELENVRKAAALDADSITSTVSKLGHGLVRAKNFLSSNMQSTDEESKFHHMLESFVEHAEGEITSLLEEEKRIMSLVKNTVDYFHGSTGKDEGLRLFVIVRDFLLMLDKSCNEVRKSVKMAARISTSKDTPTVPPTKETNKSPSPDLRQRLFPAITDRRMDSFSSDDES